MLKIKRLAKSRFSIEGDIIFFKYCRKVKGNCAKLYRRKKIFVGRLFANRRKSKVTVIL